MALIVTFDAEIERALRVRAATTGQDVESLVIRLVEAALARGAKATKPKRRKRSGSFRERIDAWIALHPVLDHPIDDSRESIYEGCGE